MKHLKKFNEMLDPMGKWTDSNSNENSPKKCENCECDLEDGCEKCPDCGTFNYSSPYEDIYGKFCNWICNEKGFDFYDGQDDFHQKFVEVLGSDMNSEEKADELAGFLEDKWGLYDGYSEVCEYLQNLINEI